MESLAGGGGKKTTARKNRCRDTMSCVSWNIDNSGEVSQNVKKMRRRSILLK